MPVYKELGQGNRPDWCTVASAGLFRIPSEGGRFDNHYHDCNEYWLIFKGRAKVRSEGLEYLVGPGDILCTRAGDEHDIIEVYEDLEAFWFEEATPPGGRAGHLHRTETDAAGHSTNLGAYTPWDV